MKLNTALTIAGSDCSGGAGIQADIKTALANGVFGMSAITALTAQNTMGVTGIHEVPPEFLAEEIDAVFDDIPPDAVKAVECSLKIFIGGNVTGPGGFHDACVSVQAHASGQLFLQEFFGRQFQHICSSTLIVLNILFAVCSGNSFVFPIRRKHNTAS